MGYRYEDMGYMRRKIAEERGMTLEELNKIGEKEDWTDKIVDEYQRKLGEKEDNLVISGWTSFHFIPHSLKLFLDVSEEEGSRRIFNDPSTVRKTESTKFSTLEDVKQSVHNRAENSSRRYHKYYGLDIYDPKHYDLFLDTTNLNADEEYKKVLEFIRSKQGK